MTLYNGFGEKILRNSEDFLSAFRRNEQTTGHVIFFGLAEHYCNFKESEVKWRDSTFHLQEAKVFYTICFHLSLKVIMC